MASKGFQFKQFFVAHDRCAMKVGTDGTLLGAWCPLPNPCTRVLDVGTGSGLIALMLAQRLATGTKDLTIDALDIDEAAVAQAQENFDASPWKAHLQATRCAIQEFSVGESGYTIGESGYDLIVSNPPYFQNSLKNPDKGREMARHTDTLSYEQLLRHSLRLLRVGGYLCLILPAEAESEIQGLAEGKWAVKTIVRVHTKPGKEAKRVMIQLQKTDAPTAARLSVDCRSSLGPTYTSFYIESAHSPRSEEYAELTKDFYL